MMLLTPSFFETTRENKLLGGFILLHESYHLDEGILANEQRAWAESWPKKEQFGFFRNWSHAWRSVTETAHFDTIIRARTGAVSTSIVKSREYVWGTTGSLPAR